MYALHYTYSPSNRYRHQTAARVLEVYDSLSQLTKEPSQFFFVMEVQLILKIILNNPLQDTRRSGSTHDSIRYKRSFPFLYCGIMKEFSSFL